MKQKIITRNRLLLSTFLLFLIINIINSENLKSNEKDLVKRLRESEYYETPVIIPNQHYHLNHQHLTPHQQFHHRHHILPLIRNNNQQIYEQQIDLCPCINEVKCPPCGVVYEPSSICPCAPKLNCPVCPPLSLIHEIASKKARQDQILTSNLIGIATQISTLLKTITRYATEIAKFETEAKKAARNMEEASLKAQYAKKMMIETSEKARLIAKSTLYKRPCVGCPPDIHGHAHPIKPMWYGMYNRIFPDEVPNLNKYLNSNFKKNYRDKKGMKNKQNLAPLEVKSTSVNLSKRKIKL